MSQKQRLRLIEEILPLGQIGVESSKAVAKGDIHALHTWFARRPLAACRAAVFASLVDAPATETEREELLKLIVESLPNKAPQEKPEVIEAMRARILATFDGRAPRVLDPFAGGGSIPLEAARLGCETYAHDLNPNAILTLLGTVDYPVRFADTLFPLPPTDEDLFDTVRTGQRTGNLVKAVEEWGNWVLQQVRPKLQPYYADPEGNTVVAYLWAKTVRCTNPNCGGEIPLVAHRWLYRLDGKSAIAYRILPQPDKSIRTQMLTGKAAHDDHPARGTMAGGSVQCPHCPQTVSPAEVKAQFVAGEDGRALLAIAARMPNAAGLKYRAPEEADREAYRAAVRALELEESRHDDPFLSFAPDEPFPEKARGIELGRYGVRSWGQMFNARQSLALATLAATIRRANQELLDRSASVEEAQAVCLYLAFSLSRMARKFSESANWNVAGGKIESSTAGHKLQMLWDYAEGNPLSGASASWQNMHEWGLPSLERVLGSSRNPTSVSWGDAVQLASADNSFDAVLTDPPYYDSVPYSNLADMQYIWLHRALGDILPEHFPAPLTPKKAEIMQDNARHENVAAARAFFEERMQAALAEMHRVLKPDGIALVMYAHTDTSAWETLVSALINAGFQVTASWPVNTETRSRQVWLGGVVLQSTIFLVCRKRTRKGAGYIDEILPDMHKAVQQALARFWAAGIGGADFFISAIGPALSVFSRYDEVRYSSGQRVSIANFLTLVRQAVVDYSLQQALKGVTIGEVDKETQFALLWRWTYGHKEVETGAALLLDKATGVELGDLERRGLLKRVDNNRRMVLLGPEERPDVVEQTLNRLRTGAVPLIDAIHCAGMLWKTGQREALLDLLATHGEPLRQVAQALAEIQKNGADERKLTLGFLGAWPQGLTPRPKPAEPKQSKSKPVSDQQLPLLESDL